ncbi:elongation factor Ts [Chloroflexota bacterium]
MKISASSIKELRSQSGAGVMDCRNALLEAQGDANKALEFLKQHSLVQAQNKTKRSTNKGLVETYLHGGGRIGAMVEVNCETDFVARTDEFKELVHHLAMQVAAMPPQFISGEEVPEGAEVESQSACLLLQPFIRDTDRTVHDIIIETIAKVGENIKISRFARFELGK